VLFSMMALAAPRVFATAWDAFGVTWQHAHAAIDRREAVTSLVSLIQLAVLALSPIGLALTLISAARRITRAVWRGTETRPRARAFVLAASSATLTAVVLSWWTNGDYRPVAAAERGTLSRSDVDVRAAFGYPRHRRPRDTTPQRPNMSRRSGTSRVKTTPVPANIHTAPHATPRQIKRGATTATHVGTAATTTEESFVGTGDTTPWSSDTTTQDDASTPTVTAPTTTTTTTTTTTAPTTTSGP
jgi:hypothetical protein